MRTRFAPSPTGALHIGGVRTALFNWLYAKHCQGRFILRIEDTDRQRSSDEAIQTILDVMAWLGLDYDEGPYFQTQRLQRYQTVIQQLLEKNLAYYCDCNPAVLDEMRQLARQKGEKPRYDGRCRHKASSKDPNPHSVIRFKNPLDGQVVVNDLVQGKVVFENSEFDDLIIARSDGSPTYNLTVIVDDIDMRITHVIRGDDHLNNTPRQINIGIALEAILPEYAHIPMVLDENGKKMSKRAETASALQYKELGYLPAALLNYLARLGWSHGDQEVFSVQEMIQCFDIKDVNKAPSCMDTAKLTWLNQHHLQSADNTILAQELKIRLAKLGVFIQASPPIEAVVEVQKKRVKNYQDMAQQSVYFYADFDCYDVRAADKYLSKDILSGLIALRTDIEALNIWQPDTIQQCIGNVVQACGIKLGKLAQPLRVAVTGGAVSPSIDQVVFLIGKNNVLQRLDKAIAYISR